MSESISIAEFKKLAKEGRVGKNKQGDKAKSEMFQMLIKTGFEVTREYRFCNSRKFCFDYALIDKNIAIEYEGLMSEKSRHTTITGYTSNCDKYNLACILGWKVLRYTALNYKQLESDLSELLK